MRKLISAMLSAILISAPLPSLAFGQNDVPMDIAERGMPLVVSPEGCVVNVTTGTITAIALSDRSSFVYSQVQNSVYIKPIQRQQFEGVVSMHDGSTTLRIWVGNKILRFKVRYASSGSRDVNIIEKTQFVSLPVPQRKVSLPPAPILSASVPVPSPSPTFYKPTAPLFTSDTVPLLKPVATLSTATQTPTQEIKLEEEPKPKIVKKPKRIKVKKVKPQNKMVAIAPPPIITPVKTAIVIPQKKVIVLTPQKLSISLLKGLNAARIQKKVAYQSRTWNQVQDVIFNLRKGTPLDIAISKSGAKKILIQQFLKMGGFSV
jgi:hypothetical protein